MGHSIRFIHSGDIHLGAPFKGLRSLSEAWSQKLYNAIPEAYECLVDTCINREVDFLLLAGDVFDTETVSYAHYHRFLDGLRKLDSHNIPVYICAGNHDPYANWVSIFPDLPDCVHFFPSEEAGYEVFNKNDQPLAYICSRGFTNQPSHNDIAEGITRYKAQVKTCVQAPFAIGMLHTGFTIDARKAPCSLATLEAADMDYWALGHIHQMLQYTPENPRIAYSGCIQGRDVKETGPRGCLEVTLIENEKPQLEFIQLARVQWDYIAVDVSDAVSISDVVSFCINAMFDTNRTSLCEEMIVRITLEGISVLHTQLTQTHLLEEIRIAINESVPTFYCDSLVDNTQAPRGMYSIQNSELFETLIFTQAEKKLAQTSQTASKLQKLCADKGLSTPHNLESSLQDYVQRAQVLVLDVLGDTTHE